MESQRSLKHPRVWVLLLGALLAFAASAAKTETKEEDKGLLSLCPLQTVLDAKTGRLMIPSSMPFRFSIQRSHEGSPAFALEKTDEKPENALLFAEGEHNISIPSTIKQVYRLLADANPPETKFIIPDIPKYQKSGSTYYGKGMLLKLETADPVTGVDKTLVALNDTTFNVFTENHLRFAADGTFSLKYFSCDRVGNREPIHRLDFKVDVTAPQSSLDVKHLQGRKVLGPNTLIDLRSEDGGAGVAAIHYKIDDGKFIRYESEIALAELKPGPHRIVYYAEDVLGNQEAEKIYPFAFDNINPELALAFEGPKFQDNDVTYLAEASHLKLVAADKESGIDQKNAWILDQVQTLKEDEIPLPAVSGLVTLRTMVADAAGNEARLESKLFMDREAPVMDFEVLGPSYKQNDNIVVPSPLHLRLRAQDAGAGIAEIFYCLDQEPCKSYQDSVEVKKPGPVKISFYARDRVDHISPKTVLPFLVKDSQANAEVTPAREKTQWVSDTKAGAIGPKNKRYRLEIADGPGKDAKRFAIGIPIDALDAAHIDQASIQNLVLSLGGYKAEIKIPIDGDHPDSKHDFSDAEAFQKEGTQYFGPGLVVSLKASEPEKNAQSGVKTIMQSLNGRSFASYKESLKQFMAEQKYSLRYYSVDRVGNREEEHKVEFLMDMTPPKTKAKLTSPSYRNFISRTGGIHVEAEDPLSGVKQTFYALDQGDFQVYEAKQLAEQIQALKSGSHRMQYYSIDQVGNQEPKQSLDFDLDDAGPRLSHQIQGPSYQTGDVLFINKGSKLVIKTQDPGAGIDEIHYQVGDAPEQLYKSPVELKNMGRETSLSYRGDDKVKNAGETRKLVLKWDENPPASKMQFDGPYYIFDDKIFVKSKTNISIKSIDPDSGVQQTFYRINSDEYLPFQKAMTFAAHGEYNFSIYAMDRVGNREAPQVYRIIVDDEKPSLQIKGKDGTLLLGDNVLSKDSLIYISAYDSQAGIKDIYYRLGEGPSHLYRAPIRLTQAGPITLEVKALDWMGEEISKTLNYRVEP